MFNTSGHVSSHEITKEFLLSYVSELDIFRYYIPTFKRIGVSFCSNIRKDKVPSCSIKAMPSGMLLYRDFATGEKYTCIRYVQHLYSCDYNTVLRRIANDFGVLKNNKTELLKKRELSDSIIYEEKQQQVADIRIQSKSFTFHGLQYWLQYGITREVLEMYNVKQLSVSEVNDTQIQFNNKELAFAYCFGNYKYKILRPNSHRKYKWTSNADKSIVQGITQLQQSGELLIITKALKDVMSLRAFGYSAVAPQSENTELPDKAIAWLKDKWARIVLYYDNDVAGIKAAENHSLLYGIEYMHNPIDMHKDFSDYVKNEGKSKSLELLSNLLERK